MRATTVSRLSLAGLTTIGVLVSQISSAKALSLQDSTTHSKLTSSVEQLSNGDWSYDYKVEFTANNGTLESWVLPLLDITDLKSIQGDEITPDKNFGETWSLYKPEDDNYSNLWGKRGTLVDNQIKGQFSNSPWILQFKANLNVEVRSSSFNLVSKNAPRNVPFVAEFRNVVGSGYSYEIGDPYAPGASTQVPTPFLGLGLAAIAAKTAARKRSV